MQQIAAPQREIRLSVACDRGLCAHSFRAGRTNVNRLSITLIPLLIGLGACCRKNVVAVGAVTNPIGPVAGYEYTFPYPRTDVGPGVAVVRWDDGQLDVVCRPEQYHAEPIESFVHPAANPVTISDERKETLKAKVSADVKNIVEASLGAGSVTAIEATLSFVPKSIDTGTALQEVRRTTSVSRVRGSYVKSTARASSA